MTNEVKGKPNWRQWDELLVDAWEKDARMVLVINQFLWSLGCTTIDLYESSKELRKMVKEVFLVHEIKSRSPKACPHFHLSVRALFYQFFPKVNDLLWNGKKAAALSTLRKYKLTDDDQYQQERELSNVIRTFSRKSSTEIPIIEGTNAVGIKDARRALSDWSTVKPPRARSRHR